MTWMHTDRDIQDFPYTGDSADLWASSLKPVEFDGVKAQATPNHHESAGVEVLGVREQINNSGFNPLEFEGVENKMGRHRFTFTHLPMEGDIP